MFLSTKLAKWTRVNIGPETYIYISIACTLYLLAQRRQMYVVSMRNFIHLNPKPKFLPYNKMGYELIGIYDWHVEKI